MGVLIFLGGEGVSGRYFNHFVRGEEDKEEERMLAWRAGGWRRITLVKDGRGGKGVLFHQTGGGRGQAIIAAHGVQREKGRSKKYSAIGVQAVIVSYDPTPVGDKGTGDRAAQRTREGAQGREGRKLSRREERRADRVHFARTKQSGLKPYQNVGAGKQTPLTFWRKGKKRETQNLGLDSPRGKKRKGRSSLSTSKEGRRKKKEGKLCRIFLSEPTRGGGGRSYNRINSLYHAEGGKRERQYLLL